MKVAGVALQPVIKKKIITVSRVMDAAGGDVATTGVGFAPDLIVFIAAKNAVALSALSCGIWVPDVGDTNQRMFYLSPSILASSFSLASSRAIILDEGGGAKQSAIVKSSDADGFTLTWVKDGSPSNVTAYVFAVCFKLG